MKQVVARDALCSRVIRVEAEQRPPADGMTEQLPGTLYAVFRNQGYPAGAPGDFLGLVSALTAARYPARIFTDLVTCHPVNGIAADTPLATVLHHLDSRQIEAAPVLDSSGDFIGVATRTSLLYALLDQTRQLNTDLDCDRERLQQWSLQIDRLNSSLGELLRDLWDAADESDLLERGLRQLGRLLEIDPVAIGYARAGALSEADCFLHPLQDAGAATPCLGCMQTAAAGKVDFDSINACGLNTRPIGIRIADAAGDFGYGLLCPRSKVALGHGQELIATNYARALSFALSTVRARDQRQRLSTENRNLARQLVSAQEQERKRLARELHDELGQCLTAIRADAEVVRTRLAPKDPVARESVEAILAVAGQAYGVVRGLMYSLRPPLLDQGGLRPALEEAVRDWRRQFPDIAWRLVIDVELDGLDDALAIGLYRLVQEAVTNIHKHARASWVKIRLAHGAATLGCDDPCQEGDGLIVHIHDNGRGMEPNAPHGLGLVGMRERLLALGGCFHLDSVPGEGTCLRGWVPFQWTRNTQEQNA